MPSLHFDPCIGYHPVYWRHSHSPAPETTCERTLEIAAAPYPKIQSPGAEFRPSRTDFRPFRPRFRGIFDLRPSIETKNRMALNISYKASYNI